MVMKILNTISHHLPRDEERVEIDFKFLRFE